MCAKTLAGGSSRWVEVVRSRLGPSTGSVNEATAIAIVRMDMRAHDAAWETGAYVLERSYSATG